MSGRVTVGTTVICRVAIAIAIAIGQ